MKKIKIFLASSLLEFEKERMLIENFIRNVSDGFEEKYGIKLQPLLCENFDDSLTEERTQEIYNEIIRDADFCFFIFFTKVGRYTREEFNVAKEQFKLASKPKIYVYFKTVEGESATDEVKRFMSELENDFGYYYGRFSHVDTVKLRILLAIRLGELDYTEIKAEGGYCTVDGSPLMPLGAVSEFENNGELIRLHRELDRVEEEYLTLRPLYEKGGCTREVYRRFCAVAAKKESLTAQIRELEGQIFKVSLRMVKDERHGEITSRQREAYRRFELGDYDGCMSVLSSEDIDSDFFAKRESVHQQELALCRRYVREHLTAIEILFSMHGYAQRFGEIEERFEKIIPLVFEEGCELDAAFLYACYLHSESKNEKAYQIAKKLLPLYPEGSDREAATLRLLGIISHALGLFGDSESYLLRSVEIYEALCRENPTEYSRALVDSYNAVGNFFGYRGDYVSAESYCIKAARIALPHSFDNEEEGVESNSEEELYHSAEEESFHLKSVKLREALAKDDPDRYNTELAISYNNAGAFYEHTRPDKAEEYFLKAIALFDSFQGGLINPYSEELAECRLRAGLFYAGKRNKERAEACLCKARELFEALCADNPVKFRPRLANACYLLGRFYEKEGSLSLALECYLRSAQLCEELNEDDPKTYTPALGGIYNTLGKLLYKCARVEEAKGYFFRSVSISEGLAKEDAKKYTRVLCCRLGNLARAFEYLGANEEAELYYMKSARLREEADASGSYSPISIEFYESLADFLCRCGKARLGAKYRRKAKMLSDRLKKEKAKKEQSEFSSMLLRGVRLRADAKPLLKRNPEIFKPLLAIDYKEAYLYYKELGDRRKAEFCRKNALRLALAHSSDPRCAALLVELKADG